MRRFTCEIPYETTNHYNKKRGSPLLIVCREMQINNNPNADQTNSKDNTDCDDEKHAIFPTPEIVIGSFLLKTRISNNRIFRA